MPEPSREISSPSSTCKKINKYRGQERDWEPELWGGDLEPKPSLATGLLWAVDEAPHPLQSVTSRARGHRQ